MTKLILTFVLKENEYTINSPCDLSDIVWKKNLRINSCKSTKYNVR